MSRDNNTSEDSAFRVSTRQSSGIFAIRGDLDGSKESADFLELRQFIGLLIDGEEFLLPIEVMNEIIMIEQLTFVPGGPQYVAGVINLRGKILPALNVRIMMGKPTAAPTGTSRIIIVSYEDMTAGLIVDGITYVVSLTPDQVEDTNIQAKGNGANLLKGIGKRGEGVCGILDITKVFAEAAGGKLPVDDEEEDDASA